MSLSSISFKNYKAFDQLQTLKIKPITIIIGKNSSGKSSIAKLFPLLENSLSKEINEPLLLKNNGVEIAGDFDGLFFGNKRGGAGIPLTLAIKYDDNTEISVGLFSKSVGYGLYIHQWNCSSSKFGNFELEFSHEENLYIDNISKKKYRCNFNGFIPYDLIDVISGEEKQLDFECIDVDYIGPFRKLPERYFYLTGQTNYHDTGVFGENAYHILANSKLDSKSDLHLKVGEWYEKHFDGWGLKVDEKSNKPLIQIVLSNNETDINIVDVGQGMSQVLPLIVRANVINKPNSIIVLEQPELHLHPAAHGELAELFAYSSKKNKQSYIIETHSENLLLRLRKLVVDNNFEFTKEDIIIYYIEPSSANGMELMEIIIDDKGVLSDWPEGVFSEALTETLEIQKLLRQKD